MNEFKKKTREQNADIYDDDDDDDNYNSGCCITKWKHGQRTKKERWPFIIIMGDIIIIITCQPHPLNPNEQDKFIHAFFL